MLRRHRRGTVGVIPEPLRAHLALERRDALSQPSRVKDSPRAASSAHGWQPGAEGSTHLAWLWPWPSTLSACREPGHLAEQPLRHDRPGEVRVRIVVDGLAQLLVVVDVRGNRISESLRIVGGHDERGPCVLHEFRQAAGRGDDAWDAALDGV